MKNAEDLENLDKLLDSSNKSYSDSKSKKSSLEINILFRYGQFGSGTVFFCDTLYFSYFRVVTGLVPLRGGVVQRWFVSCLLGESGGLRREGQRR